MTESSDVPKGYMAKEQDVLPEEWGVKRLEDIVDFKLGRTPPRKDLQYWENGIYPWVSISDMSDFSDINFTKETVSQLAYDTILNGKIIPKETLFMSFKLTIGRTSILKVDAFHNEAIAAIFPKGSEVTRDYLFYYLPTIDFSEYYDTAIKGKTLNKAKIKSLKVSLPPLPEQHAIATTLRTVQEAKEKTDDVIAATKALKAAMMKHLFTYGPVPPEEAERVALKETEIGRVPEGWDLQPLGNISKISSGGTPSRTEPSYWNGEIPWIRTGEINYSIIEKTEEKITKAGLENSSTRMVPKGTLLMAMYGEGITRGRVGITGIDASINQAVAAIFPSEKMLTPFLYYYLEFSYEKNRLLGHGAHQRNLSATIIKTILVPIPTEKTQQQIVEILSSIDQKLAAEQSRRETLDTLFTSLLHDLMTAKIRVNEITV
ncbi:restriction endonuclease subunit S [Methanoregula sp.]|uniref:restriction endonuclease subunit S n=1 Tax=Methanoregula sp. TaxID=2052170 RepID=UPI00356913D3